MVDIGFLYNISERLEIHGPNCDFMLSTAEGQFQVLVPELLSVCVIRGDISGIGPAQGRKKAAQS